MIKPSIRRRIVSIVVGLTILMVATSVLSMVMVGRVGRLLDELKARYNPVNAHLTRIETLSLERALTLRRLVIAKLQHPPDEEAFTARKQLFEAKAAEVDQEAQSARQLINEMIADPRVASDKVGLARIESRIEGLMSDGRLLLTQANDALFAALDSRDFAEVATLLTRVDLLRDELSQRIDALREAMAGESDRAIETIKAQQSEAVVISAIATFLAALVGLIFANLVSGGIVRSVRKLLDGTKAIEAGHLDQSIDVTTRDEIGELSAAFNRMIVQLRVNRRVKETFGKYIDPRVVEGLIDQPNITAAEGQRRLMTVMFCDLKGFTTLSEGLVPQGLVRVMNRYFSLMSEPIRANGGIIDKYVGDGIMAYWGPPFVGEADHSRLACLASLEMIGRIDTLRREIPEILGVRDTPMENCDLKIGVATGEALVGSIGSEIMMSYTVMGDVVNLASRLEGANRLYGTRNLVSGKTVAVASQTLEVREIDSIVVEGQTRAEAIFEILGRRGEVTTERLASRDFYEMGLAAYRERRWEDAESAFKSSLALIPDDGPSLTLLTRVEGMETAHLSVDWDGSWRIAK
ncbi:adenylate/guanylate cyclase domain-containing protein [Rhizobium sp. NZLR1]|uniref:adenylate/guanylate cyclase domain-containing protein n=1 Tax=Rhizobium sp. NZLR1 TaxID=2731096 RepID=UPI001A98D5F2|nr:adenylate/guanylate cyclase domain-containing protein [Rhizobium sp. NZLR1]MBX5205993.1 HAMP domain-containing protein [Rhizobium sp. NZLR1]QSZ25233.1 HAMP domain-containing protein [Rhizobium sp. NZLR1]